MKDAGNPRGRWMPNLRPWTSRVEHSFDPAAWSRARDPVEDSQVREPEQEHRSYSKDRADKGEEEDQANGDEEAIGSVMAIPPPRGRGSPRAEPGPPSGRLADPVRWTPSLRCRCPRVGRDPRVSESFQMA